MEEDYEPEEEYCGESSSAEKSEDELDPEQAAFMEGYESADDIEKDSEDTEEEESEQ